MFENDSREDSVNGKGKSSQKEIKLAAVIL
jgi:hypothetical protein